MVALTPDGNGMLFSSSATNLFPGGSGGNKLYPPGYSLYYKDLTTGAVQQVDSSASGVHGDGFFPWGAFLNDTTKVIFATDATNLAPGGASFVSNIYIKDLISGGLTLVSSNSAGVIGNQTTISYLWSSDDHLVFLDSWASNLVDKDNNGTTDVFMKDLTTGVMTRVSTTATGGEVNGRSTLNLLTTDNHVVVFTSNGSNLNSGDNNNGNDIFAKNLATGAVTTLSTNSTGEIGNAASALVWISSDAQKLIFSSESSNFVAGDTNGSSDLFLKDIATGAVQRIFTADDHRDGDVYRYGALYVDHGNKLIVSIAYSNNIDDAQAVNIGNPTANYNYTYVVDVATMTATLLSSGSSGIYYGPGQQYLGSYSNSSYFSQATPDDEHLLMSFGQTAAGTTTTINNTYIVDLTATSLVKNVGDSHDNVLTGGAGVNNYLYGLGGDDRLTGQSAIDHLFGGAGNDYLDGGGGPDILSGGAGDDTYVVNEYGTSIVEVANDGVDTVLSYISWGLGDNLEALTLIGSTAVAGNGNDLNNVITGNEAGNNLYGSGGDDTLYGQAGNDSLDGGLGLDTLIGGLGDDTYIVEDTGDVVTENSGEGTDTVQASVTYSLAANIENMVLTGIAAINGTGNALANTLTGNAANNILDGASGADIMIGGPGDDTYVVDNAGDTVTENGDGGMDTVTASISYSLGANLESLVLTGAGNINATGNSLANAITGNKGNNLLSGGDGNDVLDGGAGADTMIGGAGNDTYYVDNAGDLVTELAGGGIDTVVTARSYTLGNNVEKLTITGTTNVAVPAIACPILSSAMTGTITCPALLATIRSAAGSVMTCWMAARVPTS